MNDRLKFRCWDDIHREMIDLQEQDVNPYNISDIPQNNLMQCTGLKEKNGKMIYEGDIVKEIAMGNSVSFYKVVWDINQAYGINSPGFQLVEPKTHACVPFNDEIEIIGNVYETPELLEE